MSPTAITEISRIRNPYPRHGVQADGVTVDLAADSPLPDGDPLVAGGLGLGVRVGIVDQAQQRLASGHFGQQAQHDHLRLDTLSASHPKVWRRLDRVAQQRGLTGPAPSTPRRSGLHPVHRDRGDHQ